MADRNRGVDIIAVVGAVAGERRHRSLELVEQGPDAGAVVGLARGQLHGLDPPGVGVHPEAAVVVPPRTGAVPSGTAETAPTQRDRHLRSIAERGRMGWQRASGYN